MKFRLLIFFLYFITFIACSTHEVSIQNNSLSQPLKTLEYNLNHDEIDIIRLVLTAENSDLIVLRNEMDIFGENERSRTWWVNDTKMKLKSKIPNLDNSIYLDLEKKSQYINRIPENIVISDNIVLTDTIKRDYGLPKNEDIFCTKLEDFFNEYPIEYCTISPVFFNDDISEAVILVAYNMCPGGISTFYYLKIIDNSWQVINGYIGGIAP